MAISKAQKMEPGEKGILVGDHLKFSYADVREIEKK